MSKPRSSKEASQEVQAEESQSRVYKNSQNIDHDLFKLQVSFMKKNVAGDHQEPNYQDVEHTHFFHTVDSLGIPQEYCTPIGGHFHQMTVIPGAEGKTPKVIAGPPLKWVSQKRNKRTIRVAVELNEDHHTHPIAYVESQPIKLAQVSTEFMKYQAQMDAKKPGPVEGVR